MKLLRKERVEGCLPSAPEYRYQFSEPWRRQVIGRLRDLGELDYYADFPRPYFRVRLPGGEQIKGVEGESCCRVLFTRDDPAQREEFEGRLIRCLNQPPETARRS